MMNFLTRVGMRNALFYLMQFGSITLLLLLFFCGSFCL
jgi:hypothetical protein